MSVQEETEGSVELDERIWTEHRNFLKALDKDLDKLKTIVTSFLDQNSTTNSYDIVNAASAQLLFVFLDLRYISESGHKILEWSNGLREDGPKKEYALLYCFLPIFLDDIFTQAKRAGWGSNELRNENAFGGSDFLERISVAKKTSEELLQKLNKIPEAQKPIAPTPEEAAFMLAGMQFFARLRAEQQEADRSRTNNPS